MVDLLLCRTQECLYGKIYVHDCVFSLTWFIEAIIFGSELLSQLLCSSAFNAFPVLCLSFVTKILINAPFLFPESTQNGDRIKWKTGMERNWLYFWILMLYLLTSFFFLKANPAYNTDWAEDRERISARGRVITLIIPGKKSENRNTECWAIWIQPNNNGSINIHIYQSTMAKHKHRSENYENLEKWES